MVRIPLARTPNWKVSDPDDIKSEWWSWDNPKKPWGAREKINGAESHLGVDTQHLTGPPEYYQGAYIWPEYGWVMRTPYPTRVLKYDATLDGPFLRDFNGNQPADGKRDAGAIDRISTIQ
jgi:hypothetical protein